MSHEPNQKKAKKAHIKKTPFIDKKKKGTLTKKSEGLLKGTKRNHPFFVLTKKARESGKF